MKTKVVQHVPLSQGLTDTVTDTDKVTDTDTLTDKDTVTDMAGSHLWSKTFEKFCMFYFVLYLTWL